jgi:hypothetical protein
VPVHERSDIIVAGVLERLRAEDERLGSDAEAALTSLTWDEGLETITQYGLQRLLWYEQPGKWMTDLEGRRHLAVAFGRDRSSPARLPASLPADRRAFDWRYTRADLAKLLGRLGCAPQHATAA